jgi:hypothetical protein
LEAGFKTEQVDIEGRKLTFRRLNSQSSANRKSDTQKTGEPDSAPLRDHPAYGLLKGTVTIAPGVDLTEPADPDWGKVYDE